MLPEGIKIVRVITCGREHKIGRWIEYMPSLTDSNIMSFDNNTSSCITGDTGENGASKSSVASVYESSALSVVSRGGSDVYVVSSGSRSGSGRVWMSSVPSIAKGTLPAN